MATAPQPAQRTDQRAPQRLERPVSNGRFPDKFWYDETKRPPGQAYQWIPVTILGEQNRQHVIEMARYHWTPVPANRHPEITGNDDGGKSIVIGGQMLVERPQYLNDESRAEERRAATSQVESQMVRMAAAPSGTLPRIDSAGRSTVDVIRSHERVEVPADE